MSNTIERCQRAGCKVNSANGHVETAGIAIAGLSVQLCQEHALAWDNDDRAFELAGENALLRIAIDAFIAAGNVEAAQNAGRAVHEQRLRSREYLRAWLQRGPEVRVNGRPALVVVGDR
jgi:hypothetical protein